jgi:uncharacterized protein
MKKVLSLIAVTALLLSNVLYFSASAQDTATFTQSSAETSAKSFMKLLYDGNFTDATAMFDAAVKKEMSADTLKSTWNGLAPRLGTYNGTMTVQSTAYQESYIVGATSGYEFYNLYTNITFDADGAIGGLHFYTAVNETFTPTTYTQGNIKEIHFDLVSGKYKLPAILTLPVGKTNVPAVVLVSGSGSNDRNETAYAEKPFKDIAEGLAEKGIASLRFDKRTFAYQTQLLISGAEISIDEEYTQDVATAVNYLTSYSGINKSKVYLLGHSEVGMLAPRISLSTPTVAGLILLAGSPRRWEDIVVDQVALFEPSQLTEAKAEAAETKKLDSMSTAPDETLFGLPASYIKDVDSQDAAKDAIKSGKPMLILQGERDAQVFMTDYNLWKQKLSTLSNVVYKSYPKLNHLFIEGTGKPNTEEYNVAGHVAQYVIDDIASFVTLSALNSGKASGSSHTASAKSSAAPIIANPATGGANSAIPIGAAFFAVSCAAFALYRRRR